MIFIPKRKNQIKRKANQFAKLEHEETFVLNNSFIGILGKNDCPEKKVMASFLAMPETRQIAHRKELNITNIDAKG